MGIQGILFLHTLKKHPCALALLSDIKIFHVNNKTARLIVYLSDSFSIFYLMYLFILCCRFFLNEPPTVTPSSPVPPVTATLYKIECNTHYALHLFFSSSHLLSTSFWNASIRYSFPFLKRCLNLPCFFKKSSIGSLFFGS